MTNPFWLHGADSETERQRRSDVVSHSQSLLDLLATVAVTKLQELSSSTLDDYDTPNWAYLQADRRGQARVWKALIGLCNHPEGNKNA